MPTIQQPARTTLTYQGATFKRSLIYLAIAVISFLAFKFLKFTPQIPPPHAVAGPPSEKIALGMVIFISLVSTILDASFVVDFRFFQKRIECDQENLYIIRKNKEIIVPFSTIYRLRLSSFGMMKGVRGSSFLYVIEYNEPNGRSEDTDIAVYYRMRKNFDAFRQMLQEKNPDVEIKNWSTSLDPLFRLFKKKK